MLQRGLAWALLALLLVLTVHGIYANGLFLQPVWDPVGIQRFAIFASIYAAVSALAIWRTPRWYLPLLGAIALVYTMLAVGPLAPLAIGYFAFSCYSIGAIWFRRTPEFARQSPALAIVTGLATWILFVLATARWPIHYRALYWILAGVPIAYALRKQYIANLGFEHTQTRRDLVPLAIALFPLACHWLVALKPEVSADGLAMHMVIPARMAFAHAWPFNVREFLWAVMPMGGDWAFSIAWQLAGEAGARLLNFALLALMAWILLERLHARVPGWTAGFLVAAFLSTPLTQLVTGSLFVENVVAALVLGAALLLRVHIKERRAVFFYAGCLIAGVAAASKLGAVAFVLPLLLAASISVSFRHSLAGIPIALSVGSIPYVEAMLRTGNPVFPFLNAWFRSSFYNSLENFSDSRFTASLSATTWYDLTFHSSRFIEGLDGSFGFFFFLMAPLCLVGWRRRWPKTGFVLLWVAVTGTLLILKSQGNLRYLYTALPLLTLLTGIMIASFRVHSPRLGQALGIVTGLAFLLNLCFLPAAGWYHHDFCLNQVVDRSAADNYVARWAPERKLADYLNAKDPHATSAWMEGNAIGDFHGRAYTNSWHSDLFYRRLRESTAPEGHAWLAQDLKITYFIAPSASNPRPLTNVYTREFLDLYTAPVMEFAGMELRRWNPPVPGTLETSKPYAPAGKHDEVGAYTTYAGQWTRDLQFRDAYHGTLIYSNDTRSRILIRFHGTSIRLMHTGAANRCTGLVSMDETDPVEFSEFSQTTQWQAVSAPFTAAQSGDHMLQIRFQQTRGKSAIGGCYLDLDGFIVE